MKRSDVLAFLSCAAGTAALSSALLLPGGLDAGGPEAVASPVATPKLVRDGIEFTVRPGAGTPLKAGEELKLELLARELSRKTAGSQVRITVTALAPSSPFSRVLPIPEVFWTSDEEIQLKAGDTQTIALNTGKTLPAGKVFNVLLGDPAAGGGSMMAPPPSLASPPLPGDAPENAQSANPSVVALSFSIAPDSTQPAPVAAIQPL